MQTQEPKPRNPNPAKAVKPAKPVKPAKLAKPAKPAKSSKMPSIYIWGRRWDNYFPFDMHNNDSYYAEFHMKW